ncbi:MAG: DUF5107 domain-containing protein [Sedimentisphaerales bacterium]|nr:DUF5107 domain-containing protein [Sedimentisphaerales bacterium]
MKSRYVIVILIVSIYCFCSLGDEAVRIWEEPLVLPTYKMNPADVNPMFERPLSYQGAHRIIYPYPVQDNFTNIKEDKSYKALYLENEYIKLCVLPEMGGRLFYATDKTNRYEMFYRQHVIKPAHIGMLGAWISGGIEWCVFHHHRASTFMPVDYKLTKNPDGSGTIWIGEIEPRQRMKWSIGITLRTGKSYIEADIRMFNRTENVNSFLYWANVATHANDDYQIFFPPSTKYGVYHAKNDFVHWPIGRTEYHDVNYAGVDLSWWKNHPRPNSIFAHEIKEGFLAGYDHSKDAGTVHVANHHIVAGAKLWEWGPSERGSVWDTKVLTDSDGPYAELMVGAYSDNQPDYSWLDPYEVKQAKQYWYPLRQIGGAKSANLSAAVNLEVKDDKIILAFNTTEKYERARVLLTAKGKSLIDEKISIAPGEPFSKSIPLPEGIEETDLQSSLQTKAGQTLITYKPVKLDVPDELPEVVKRPPEPNEIKTIEQLYLTGLRIKQFHNTRLNADDYFNEAVRRDPKDSRCNIQLGIKAAQKGLYTEAEKRFNTAIERISKDYTRPRDCEAYYQLGLVLKRQGRLDEAYDNLYRAVWDYTFRSAAYYHLMEIACLKGNFDEALRLLDNSLNTNSINTKALGIKSAVLRKLGKPKSALDISNKALEIDPLDHLARNERIAVLTTLSGRHGAVKEIKELDKIMHDYAESYIELAADYMNCGLYDDAVDVLMRATEKSDSNISRYPTIHYYLAYLFHKKNDNQTSHKYLAGAAKCPTDYCFPFRLETLDVLDYAIEANPDDARAYYYKGNLLYDRQPDNAIRTWEKAVQIEPSLAIAHRNLGWAYHRSKRDIPKAIASYEQAVRHNRQDPRYYFELDELHEQNPDTSGIDKRLSLLENNHQVVMKHKLALVREILVLVQAGNYDKALKFLAENHFPSQEGNRRLHDIYVDALLLRGLNKFNDKQYASALEDFLAADQYPDNHQVGRNPQYARNPQIYYFTGICRLEIDKKESAKEYFEKATQDILEEEEDRGRDRSFTFYQALALQQLGHEQKAVEIFDRLISQGQRRLDRTSDVDFFAKFGEGDPPHVRQGRAYYNIGLGHLGKGEKAKAKDAFSKAVELDVNHIWAKYYLSELLNSSRTIEQGDKS